METDTEIRNVVLKAIKDPLTPEGVKSMYQSLLDALTTERQRTEEERKRNDKFQESVCLKCARPQISRVDTLNNECPFCRFCF